MRAQRHSVWLRSGVAASCLFTAFVAGTASYAQDQDQDQTWTEAQQRARAEAIIQYAARKPDVITVLGRTPRTADSATSALTILDRDWIEARGDLAVADLLRSVPGAAVSRSGPLSGLAQVRLRGSEANHALVLVNGLDVSNPFAGEADLNHLTTLDIERVEVLRGEQSALWGSDAIGGVINIVTRDDAGASFAIETGSFGTTTASAAAGGDFGLLRGRVAFGALQSDGVDVSGSGGATDAYENYTLSANGVLDAPFGWTVTGIFKGTDAESDFDSDTDFDGALDDVDRVLDFSDRLGRASAAHDWSLGELSGTSRFTVAYLDTEQATLASGVRTALTKGSRATAAADLGVEREFDTTRLAANLRVEQELERTRNTGPTPTSAENQARKTLTQSVALELLAEGTWWTADLSARHDANERFEDADTWRVGLSGNLPNELGRLYASYGEGVKNPTFFDLFGFFPGSWVGNPDLVPERSKGWNLGVELTPTDRLTLTADYFDADLEDEIINDFSVFPATARNLAANSSRRGVELSARARLTDAWRLDASATFLDATEDGLAEVRRPETTASLALAWAPDDLPFRAAFGADYVGESEDLDFSTFPSSRVTLDAYTLVRASFAYEVADGIELTVRGENLTDENYEDVLGFATAGAGAYVGVRIRR